MKCAPGHASSVLNTNSFVLKWKHVVSVQSPLSLFSCGGLHIFICILYLHRKKSLIPQLGKKLFSSW